jgi:DNA polymerase-3 subunit delta'
MQHRVMASSTADPDCYRHVVGQHAAREFLASQAANPVNAYMLVGPPGSGKKDLALAFAADIVCAHADPADWENIVDLVLRNMYADVIVQGAEGARVRKVEAESLTKEAYRKPVVGAVKVIIGVGFDTIIDEASALLLKTIEEPGPSVVFVLLADDVPTDLVTIASRCVRVNLPHLSADEIREALLADPEMMALPTAQIERAATGAMGDLRRARVLATDERFAVRVDTWAAVPGRLDGTGATVHRLAAELMAMVEEAFEPMHLVLVAETAAADAEAEEYGSRRESRTDEKARHARIERRFKNGELQAGLGVLARCYRDAALAGTISAVAASDAVEAMSRLSMELVRNPNHKLQLQALFLKLPSLPSARPSLPSAR